MAGDSYDPNAGTDTSNGTPDWWTINNPPPVPTTPGVSTTSGQGGNYIGRDGHIYTPDGQDLGPSGQDPNPATAHSRQGIEPAQFVNDPTTSTAAQNQWGGPVSAYGGSPYPTFTPPPLPDYLQKGFALPSATELTSSPGYLARFNQGQQARQRSAASHGTILNGGTQVALDRAGQEFASNEYGNLVNQKLNERQQQSSDWLNLAYGPAWQQNQAAVNQYGQMYGQYKDLINNNRNSQSDYWQQQLDLLKLAQSSAAAGNPGTGA